MTDSDGAAPEVIAATVAKLQAEAEQARAEAARAREEAQLQALDAKLRATEVRKEELALQEREEAFARAHTDDKYHHIYQFKEEVNSSSVKRCTDRLTEWTRLDGNNPQPITLVFNSPGGSVFAGMDLFDFLLDLRRKGHHITTVAVGMAASMAGIILQAGDKRVMGREAMVLIHEVSTIALGKIGEIEDEVKLVKKIQSRVLRIFADRSRSALANGTSEIALTEDQFDNGDRALEIPGWSRKDWWLDSEECLRYGIVDKVTA